jgi:glycosyltransferase involved in cell wall biosynthesis
VGRPAANKNLNRLVDAFALLKRNNPELQLVLAGKSNPEYEKLRQYADAKTDGVKFTGFVSEGQLRWLYERAEVYVFPSLSEGFGLPGL